MQTPKTILNLRGISRQAFTLVELLVVVAIITLLLAVLLPSLGRARELAKTTVCGANLKQLATAESLYAADNEDRMIPFSSNQQFGYTYGDRSSAGNDATWYEAMFIFGYVNPGFDSSFRTAPAGFAAKPVTQRNPFYCPAGLADAGWSNATWTNAQVTVSGTAQDARRSVNAQCPVNPSNTNPPGGAVNYHSCYTTPLAGDPSPGSPPQSRAYLSCWYACNSVPNGISMADIQLYPSTFDLTAKFCKKLSSVVAPGATVLFLDGISGNNLWSNTRDSRIAYRHNQQTITNVVFCDGHVESVSADTSNFPTTATVNSVTGGNPSQGDANYRGLGASASKLRWHD